MISGSASRKSNPDAARWLARFEAHLLGNLADHAATTARESLDYPGPQEPSKPGEAPNSQTGALHDGIQPDVEPHRSTVSSSRNGSSVVPKALENGTADGRLAARPYMRPAFDETVREFRTIVAESKGETR